MARFVSTLILTRLLTPADYGVFGTALAVTMTLEFFSDVGVIPALVRHPRGAEREYLLTGWWITLSRGAALSLLIAGLAWPLARFYRQPELVPVLIVLGLRPLIVSLRSPAIPLLRREVSYREVFQSELAQAIVSTVASVALVYWFRSVWGVAIGTILGAAAFVVVSYFVRPMRPDWYWDREIAKDIGTIGRQVFINTFLMGLWLNIDRTLGLRLVTAAEMGFYTLAWNMVALAERLVNRVSQVYYSMLARRQNVENRLAWHENNARRITRWLMPLMALGIVVSPWFIQLLFPKRFHFAQVPMAILMGRLMLRTLGRVQTPFAVSIAKLHLETRAYLTAFLTQAALIWPLVHFFGLNGMALSSLFSTFVLVGMQTFMLGRHAGISSIPLWRTTAWAIAGLLALWALRYTLAM